MDSKAIATAAVAFLIKIGLQEPAKEMGSLLTDKIRFWRFNNQLNGIYKAMQHCKAKGFSPTIVPFKILAPLIEGLENEDEELLHDMWSALLGNAAGGYAHEIHPGYFLVLKQMTSIEAKLIKFLYTKFHKDEKSNFLDMSATEGLIESYLIEEKSNISVEFITDNFKKLGLMIPIGGKSYKDGTRSAFENFTYTITLFAIQLITYSELQK